MIIFNANPKITNTTDLKGSVFISKELDAYFNHLHETYPNREWSGPIIYSEKGKFGSENYKCTIKDFILMDIGTAGGTDFRTDAKDDKYYIQNVTSVLYKNRELKEGLVHTHHNMDVFFSGTDNIELINKANIHTYFLSLIINAKGKKIAKIAYAGEIQKDVTLKGKYFKENITTKGKEQGIITFDLEVYVEKQSYPTKWIEREKNLNAILQTRKVTTAVESYKGTKYNNWELPVFIEPLNNVSSEVKTSTTSKNNKLVKKLFNQIDKDINGITYITEPIAEYDEILYNFFKENLKIDVSYKGSRDQLENIIVDWSNTSPFVSEIENERLAIKLYTYVTDQIINKNVETPAGKPNFVAYCCSLFEEITSELLDVQTPLDKAIELLERLEEYDK